MITGSALTPVLESVAALPTYKVGRPADLPVTGGPASAVFGETLRRHLSPSNCRNQTALEVFSQFRKSGCPFLLRPAMQEFVEGHTGPPATRE